MGEARRHVRGFGPIILLLLAFGARADPVADWADTTTEIATDGPNTIRTMALAQNAVYEAVNAITARDPRGAVMHAGPDPSHRHLVARAYGLG